MIPELRILHLEDRATDAELLLRVLRLAELKFQARCVETRADFEAALADFSPDIILADYFLPGFDGLTALGIAQARCPDVPFIIISGTLGEERAVEALKLGATDFVLKDRLDRLVPVVQRALREADSRAGRQRAETALIESEAGLLEAQSLAHLGNWNWDMTRDDLSWSDEVFRIFGLTPQQFGPTYAAFLERVHPLDRDWVVAAVEAVVRDGAPYDFDHRIVRPDGSERYVHENGKVLRDAAGRPFRMVGTVQDITERKKLEEQVRQSQKMEVIGQLASGVAHDFNNILTAIQMNADLLNFGEYLSPDDQELVRDIGAYVERAAALTRQLLLFGQQDVMCQQDLDLKEVINGIGKMLTRTLGADIEMLIKLPKQPLFIRGDAGMMDQVLMNLTVNARDAMPKGGALVIEIGGVEFDELAAAQHAQARSGSFVQLSVSDTGSGIPAEILPKIFEPFFTTKGVGRGTGLGLATVFGIVRQHHGWISVCSEVGRGTTFRIYLPRLEKTSAKTSIDTQFTALTGGKETILLIEDEKSLNALACKALTGIGYRVRTAFDGPDALKVWKEQHAEIQLVLTDIVMPGGMNGIELGEQLLRENPKLKIIYVSGYSTEVVGKDFPLTEGRNFLTKPYQLAKLAQTVRAMLDA